MFSVFHFSLRSEVITKITTVWTKIKTQMIKLADFFLLVICCVYHKFDFKQRCKSFNCSILIRRYATGNYILMLIRTNPKVNWFRFAFDRITTVWPWFERIKKKRFSRRLSSKSNYKFNKSSKCWPCQSHFELKQKRKIHVGWQLMGCMASGRRQSVLQIQNK